jgi:hypothetical protein
MTAIIPPLKRNAWTILKENALQILMYLLGTALVGLIWLPLGLIFFLYGILSNYLYMAWICPYCGHYLLATCAPAGTHLRERIPAAVLGALPGLVPTASRGPVPADHGLLLAGAGPAGRLLPGRLLATAEDRPETLRGLRNGRLPALSKTQTGGAGRPVLGWTSK